MDDRSSAARISSKISKRLQQTKAGKERQESPDIVRPKRILLTNGEGFAARQLASILKYKGHLVYIVFPNVIAAREWGGDADGIWTVRNDEGLHRAPTWLSTIVYAIKKFRINIVIPMQDEMALLALGTDRLLSTGVHFAIVPFGTLRLVMDKITTVDTLNKLKAKHPLIKQPLFDTIFTASDYLVDKRPLDDQYPLMVKDRFSINGRGIRKLESGADLEPALEKLDLVLGFAPYFDLNRFGATRAILFQEWVPGTFIRVQGVFDGGVLQSWHAYAGFRQSKNLRYAAKREHRRRDSYRDRLIFVGHGLSWHGLLTVDLIETKDGEILIVDVNPRMTDLMHSYLCGDDLVESLLELALKPDPKVTNPADWDPTTETPAQRAQGSGILILRDFLTPVSESLAEWGERTRPPVLQEARKTLVNSDKLRPYDRQALESIVREREPEEPLPIQLLRSALNPDKRDTDPKS